MLFCSALAVGCFVGLRNDVVPSELLNMESVEALTSGENGYWDLICIDGEWQWVWIEKRSL